MNQNRDEEQERLKDNNGEEKDPQIQFCDEMCREIQAARKCELCCRVLLSILFFLLIGLLFLWKNVVECERLGKWNRLFWIFCFVTVVLRLVDGLLVLIRWKLKNIKCVFGYHGFMDGWEWVIYLLYMIVATVLVLIGGEECDELIPFERWFLIISYVVLLVWACINYTQRKKWEEENL